MAIGAVLATGTFAFFNANLATASHGGSGDRLTASDGSNYIERTSGGTLAAIDNVNDASWSPDGCRAVYTNNLGDVTTLRHDDGNNQWWVADFVPGVTRNHPTWRGTGSTVVWSERTSSADPWSLMYTASSYGWSVEPLSPDDAFHYTHPDAGPDRKVVFQKQADDGSGNPTGTPEVWFYDPDLGADWEARTDKVTDGSNPALSPDGTRVAFVQSDNQIWVVDAAGGLNPVQVTSNSGNKDNPVWSPDGLTIAFNVGSAVYTAFADGSQAAAPVLVGGLTGKPGYEPGNANEVVRLFGANRFTTAVATSQSHWATAGVGGDTRAPAQSVVLSRSDTFADALGGSALAAAKEGPLLLTPPTSLNADTKAEIARVLGTNPSATVYLLGSTGALSQAVENEVVAMGYTVKRLQGPSRYETAIAIADEINPSPDLILAATGRNFPDALAAGAAAGSYNVPGTGLSAVVILTSDYTLPTAVDTYLANAAANGSWIFGIGLQAAEATEGYASTPIYGPNRYETALITGLVFFGGEHAAGVATGTNWPDALAGGALMATLNGPVLLTPSNTNTLNAATEFFLDVDCGSISTGYIFGSSAVVNTAIEDHVGKWISGPAGYTKSSNPTTVASIKSATTNDPNATNVRDKRTPEELKASAEQVTRKR